MEGIKVNTVTSYTIKITEQERLAIIAALRTTQVDTYKGAWKESQGKLIHGFVSLELK